jgi:hypothetical protein
MKNLDIPPFHKGERNCRGDTVVVYALCDPRDGDVRYIGVTNSVLGRFKEHMRMYGGNERKNAWLRELLNKQMLPLLHTLEIMEDERQWRDREIAWIEAYTASGADLLNDEISKLKQKRERERLMRVRMRLQNHRTHRHRKRAFVRKAAEVRA